MRPYFPFVEIHEKDSVRTRLGYTLGIDYNRENDNIGIKRLSIN